MALIDSFHISSNKVYKAMCVCFNKHKQVTVGKFKFIKNHYVTFCLWTNGSLHSFVFMHHQHLVPSLEGQEDEGSQFNSMQQKVGVIYESSLSLMEVCKTV